MKYLKTYESLKDPNDCMYYQTIDHYEWEKLMGTTGVRIGLNRVSLTPEERSELAELLFNNRIDYEFDKKTYSIIGQKTREKFTLGDSMRFKVIGADLDKKTLDYSKA